MFIYIHVYTQALLTPTNPPSPTPQQTTSTHALQHFFATPYRWEFSVWVCRKARQLKSLFSILLLLGVWAKSPRLLPFSALQFLHWHWPRVWFVGFPIFPLSGSAW